TSIRYSELRQHAMLRPQVFCEHIPFAGRGKIVKLRTEASDPFLRIVPSSISLSAEIRFRQRPIYHAGDEVPQSLASIVKKHDSCRGFTFRQTATIVLWAFARVPHTLDPIEVSPGNP